MAKWRIEIPAKYSIVIEEDDDGMVMKRAQAETTLVRRMGEMRQTNDSHNTATVAFPDKGAVEIIKVNDDEMSEEDY
jgi:DNA-binding transcriptional regulator/RsmH inhibitor MraZ